MPKNVLPPPPAPVPATLTEQKSDFTAEGSPPPGRVAKAVPATVHPETKGTPAPRAAPRKPRTKRAALARYP